MTENRNNYIILLSLLLIAGFVLTSFISHRVSVQSLRSQIQESELPLTSDTIYSEIQRDLLTPVFISSLMARDTFVRDWIIAGEQNPEQIERYLAEIKEKYGAITSFLVSDRTLNYYYYDGILKTVSPDEYRDQWYFRVKAMENEYETNVDPDMANRDTMTIFVNYRVFDYAGNFIGATGVGLTLSSVMQMINSYQETYERDVFFTDPNGTITLQGTNTRITARSIHEIDGLSGLAGRILSSDNESFSYLSDSGTVHLNARFLPEFNWYLIVKQTEEKTVRAVDNALKINLVFCAVITSIILGLTHLIISAYQRRIECLASTDKLTGALNRYAIDITIDQAIRDAARNKSPLSVILFDIDHFKKVNDRFGHLAGDAVLKGIVSHARNCIRESDILCRWGGEEFLVLLRDCPLAKATRLAEMIRLAVETQPVTFQAFTIAVTISLGVSEHCPGTGEDQMFNDADQALYLAKKNGRNRVETLPCRLDGRQTISI